MIERQRALRVGPRREEDEADPVFRPRRDEFPHDRLDRVDAARALAAEREVLGEHAARDVDREHDVDALAMELHRRTPGLRTRERGSVDLAGLEGVYFRTGDGDLRVRQRRALAHLAVGADPIDAKGIEPDDREPPIWKDRRLFSDGQHRAIDAHRRDVASRVPGHDHARLLSAHAGDGVDFSRRAVADDEKGGIGRPDARRAGTGRSAKMLQQVVGAADEHVHVLDDGRRGRDDADDLGAVEEQPASVGEVDHQARVAAERSNLRRVAVLLRALPLPADLRDDTGLEIGDDDAVLARIVEQDPSIRELTYGAERGELGVELGVGGVEPDRRSDLGVKWRR